jgi:hypothetical protein
MLLFTFYINKYPNRTNNLKKCSAAVSDAGIMGNDATACINKYTKFLLYRGTIFYQRGKGYAHMMEEQYL